MALQRVVHLIGLIIVVVVLACSAGVVWGKNEIVSFNKATVEQLMAIKGTEIPEAVARAIVAHREKNGEFKKAAALADVPGMTDDLYRELNPVLNDDGSDVVYDPDTEPVVVPLKT